ncbi:MAG: right-handed parallel beta-helix repeat-containing protein, partial [Planctomycetes bacterium]|nr:right-handed parallel beta-helix repeat-containing protein [Planctomycetota bacterium]
MKITPQVIGWILVLIAGVFFAPAADGQAIFFVDPNAEGVNDGSSWSDAFNYMQDALAAAQNGDEIRVAEGIYRPDRSLVDPNGSGDREATFQLINGVELYGGYAGYGAPVPNYRDVKLHESILSGDLNGNDVEVVNPEDLIDDPYRAENSYHVVTGNGTDETAVLNGFTITSGNANGPLMGDKMGAGMLNDNGSCTIINCLFRGNIAYFSGGGMSNLNSSPILTDCDFCCNAAYSSLAWSNGGGIYNGNSNPILTNCTFSNNLAYYAGAMNIQSGSLTLIKCTFNDNSATLNGGAMSVSGGAHLNITQCTFRGNTSDSWGGAISTMANCSWTIDYCTFSGNTSVSNGGALHSSGAGEGSRISNSIFVRNAAGTDGGAIYNYLGSACFFTSCYFLKNSGRGGGIFNEEADPTVANCIFSSHSESGIYNLNSSPAIKNCTFVGHAGYWHNYSIFCYGNSNTEISNCILWSDSTATSRLMMLQAGSHATVSYSTIQGGRDGIWKSNDSFFEWGVGNNDLDPQLTPDGHLTTGSPCINLGNPHFTVDPNAPKDIDGEDRIIDGRMDIGADEFLDSDGDRLPNWWEIKYFDTPHTSLHSLHPNLPDPHQ